MRFLKRLVLDATVAWVRMLRRWRTGKGLLYVVPPASAGSLGDQALLTGLAALLPASYPNRICQVLLPGWQEISVRGMEADALPVSLSVKGLTNFVWRLLDCRHFGILGADVMDGRYSPDLVQAFVTLCNLGARCGVPTTIFGFSFSGTPDPKAVAALSNLDSRVTCLCRDPVSRQRFEQRTGNRAQLVADLAFRMDAHLDTTSTHAAAEWIGQQRATGRRVVGLNVNVLPTSGETARTIAAYAGELTALLRSFPDLVCVMLPHDLRKGQSDHVSLVSVRNAVPQDLHERIHVLDPPFSAWDVKGVAALADLIVTGRMHLAIAALAQGVPAIGIAYQGKFEGLYAYFGMQELLLDPDSVATPGLLAGRIRTAFERVDDYRQRIATALPQVLHLSAQNTAHLT